MPAIRVYTSTGWQDVAQAGKAAEVYEQPGQPSAPSVGAIWIDTDAIPAAAAQYGPPLVTALPTTPYDGQEISLLVDSANGIVWHMRYRAASPNTQKWEFLGGLPLYSYLYAPSVPNQTSWISPSDWPAIPIPIAGLYGDWFVESGVRISTSNIRSSANFATMMTGFGTAQITGMTTYVGVVQMETATMRGKTGSVPPAAWPFRPGYAIFGSSPTPADVVYDNIWISVLPIKIGLS